MGLEQLIDNLDQMPATLLLSKLCPKGIETTMFAILAGFSNIGLSLSSQIGGWFVAYFGFNFQAGAAESGKGICNVGGATPNEPASFHGMAQALVLGNLLLPSLTIPLTWIFIPNQPLSADFLDEGLEPEVGIELQGGESVLERADASHSRSTIDR